jgi:cell wall teichoic acid glycosylation protein gtcA
MDIIRKYFTKELILYGIFGVLTTAIDWLSYTWLRFFKVDELVATVIAWILAVLFAFITNKIYVFESFNKELKFIFYELGSFVLARLGTGIINLFGMWLLVKKLFVNEFISKAGLSVLCIIINYVLSKLFIFKKKIGENNAK